MLLTIIGAIVVWYWFILLKVSHGSLEGLLTLSRMLLSCILISFSSCRVTLLVKIFFILLDERCFFVIRSLATPDTSLLLHFLLEPLGCVCCDLLWSTWLIHEFSHRVHWDRGWNLAHLAYRWHHVAIRENVDTASWRCWRHRRLLNGPRLWIIKGAALLLQTKLRKAIHRLRTFKPSDIELISESDRALHVLNGRHNRSVLLSLLVVFASPIRVFLHGLTHFPDIFVISIALMTDLG